MPIKILMMLKEIMLHYKSKVNLLLIANVVGVHMSKVTFKMLQNVGKLVMFIVD